MDRQSGPQTGPAGYRDRLGLNFFPQRTFRALVLGDTKTGVTSFATGLNRGYGGSARDFIFESFGQMELQEPYDTTTKEEDSQKTGLSIPLIDGSALLKEQMVFFLENFHSMEDSEIQSFWFANKKKENDCLIEEFSSLNHLCFRRLSCVFLLFSMAAPVTLLSIYQTWAPLVNKTLPYARIFVIGNKRDLRPHWMSLQINFHRDKSEEQEREYETVENNVPKPQYVPPHLRLPRQQKQTRELCPNQEKLQVAVDNKRPIEESVALTSHNCILIELRDFLFFFFSFYDILKVSQCCTVLNTYITNNLISLFLDNVNRRTDFISTIQGKFLAKLCQAKGYFECCSRELSLREETFERRKTREMNIFSTGPARSKLPEVDRVWGMAIRSLVLPKVPTGLEKIVISKWD